MVLVSRMTNVLISSSGFSESVNQSDLPSVTGAHRLGNISEFLNLLSLSPHFGFYLARGALR